MTEVRKHRRRTATGKTTTVRQHHRDTGDGDGTESGEEWDRRMASSSAAPHVSSMEPVEPVPAGDFWADDEPEMSDDFRKLLAQAPDDSLGEEFRKLKALRDSGYDGPVDQDGKPAPEPKRWRDLSREERKAAVARYKAADEALQANGEAEQAAGIDWETDRFHELNHALLEAEKDLPWYRRCP